MAVLSGWKGIFERITTNSRTAFFVCAQHSGRYPAQAATAVGHHANSATAIGDHVSSTDPPAGSGPAASPAAGSPTASPLLLSASASQALTLSGTAVIAPAQATSFQLSAALVDLVFAAYGSEDLAARSVLPGRPRFGG